MVTKCCVFFNVFVVMASTVRKLDHVNGAIHAEILIISTTFFSQLYQSELHWL